MIALVFGALACAGVCVWGIVEQWRIAARKSDKFALQVWALHEGPRACWCASCRAARRFLGLPAETPRWPVRRVVRRG